MVLLTLGASVAHAQRPTVSNRSVSGFGSIEVPPEDDPSDFVVNIRDCVDIIADTDTDLSFQWSLRNTAALDDETYAVRFQRPDESCDTASVVAQSGSGASSDCLVLEDGEIGSSTIAVEFDSAAEFFGFTDTAECLSSERGGDYSVHLVYEQQVAGGENQVDSSTIRVDLSLGRPATPTLDESGVVAGESTISVEWTDLDGDDIQYRVYYSRTPFSPTDLPEDVDATATSRQSSNSASISGVVQNQTYYIAVVSVDSDTRNESLFSDVIEVSTSPTADFWELYHANGGRETGGFCSAMPRSGRAGFAFIVVAGLVTARRRRVR